MSYFPLDREILSSSVWAQGTPEQLKIWLYLLVTADPRTGIVADSDPGIALRCGLALDVTTEALDWLASPDPYSRTKDHDGQRIQRLPDGGIRIFTYLAHQNRDYSTPRVRAFRQRKGASETVKRVSTVTETTDTDTDTDKRLPPLPPKEAKGSESTAQLRQDLLEVVAQLVKLEGQPDQEIVKRLTAVNGDGTGARKLSVEALLQYCARKGNFEWASVALDNGRSRLAELEREKLERAQREEGPVDLGARFPDEGSQ